MKHFFSQIQIYFAAWAFVVEILLWISSTAPEKRSAERPFPDVIVLSLNM